MVDTPQFENCALVTDDAALAASTSVLFVRAGRYLPVLDSPRIKRSDWTNEVIRRRSTLHQIDPKLVLLGSLEEKAARGMELGWKKCVRVASYDEVCRAVRGYVKIPKEAIDWGETSLGAGVYLARLQRKQLLIHAGAEGGPSLVEAGRHLLVACEAGDALTELTASNLAFAYRASYLTFPKLPSETCDRWIEDLYALGEGGDVGAAFTEIADRARSHLSEFDFSPFQSILFVTNGFPWGTGFPGVPTTHMYGYPDFGRCVVQGLWASQSSKRGARNALLIEPSVVEAGEIDAIAQALSKNGTLTRVLPGASATIAKIQQLLDFVPHDILVISSHAGDAKGERVTYEYADDEGQPRSLTVDHTHSFGYDRAEDKVAVTEFTRFVSLDGIAWEDDSGKAALPVGSAISSWVKLGMLERNKYIVSSQDIKRVASSMAIQLHDGPWLFISHGFPPDTAPLVLNNCCWSWHEIGQRMMFAGARGYVGALFPVLDPEAQEVGRSLFEIAPGGPTFRALWLTQSKVYGSSSRRPYVMLGLPNVSVPVNVVDSTKYVNEAYLEGLAHWSEKARTYKEEELRKNAQRASNFLAEDLQIFRKVISRMGPERPTKRSR